VTTTLKTIGAGLRAGYEGANLVLEVDFAALTMDDHGVRIVVQRADVAALRAALDRQDEPKKA
jgi:hypothetical protein